VMTTLPLSALMCGLCLICSELFWWIKRLIAVVCANSIDAAVDSVPSSRDFPPSHMPVVVAGIDHLSVREHDVRFSVDVQN